MRTLTCSCECGSDDDKQLRQRGDINEQPHQRGHAYIDQHLYLRGRGDVDKQRRQRYHVHSTDRWLPARSWRRLNNK